MATADLSLIDNTIGFWSLGDFRPQMPLVRGRTALIHRLCVRLQTPRDRFTFRDPVTGELKGWVGFGTDMAQYLNSKTRPAIVASAAEAECLGDEQVEDVKANAEYENGGRAIRLRLVITDADGPFERTLLIEQAKLTLVDLDAA